MGTSGFTVDQMRAALRAVREHGTHKVAGDALGVSKDTIYRRLKQAGVDGITEDAPVDLPVFADEDEPIDDVIERMSRNFERSKRAHDAKQWFPVKIKEKLPIGILMVGDPHVDDNGCNWPVLRRHMELCRTTEGLYAINIGDSSNCWGGRLTRKYADQDASVRTARRLVEWLLLNSGAKWLLWLYGNHEHMGDGAPLLAEMNKRYGTKKVPMLDWAARFTLDFPNDVSIRVNVAHDFAGNSMWNPVHGPVKAAKFGDRVDLLVCGHKHNWAISQWELAEQGTAPLMIRTRGYKHHDDYALKIGAHEQEEGQSILVVIDPEAKSRAGRVQAFVDIERGVEYLKTLRA